MAEARGDGKTSFAAVTIDVAAGLDLLSASLASGLELVAYWEQPSEGIAAAALGSAAVRTADDAVGAFALIEELARPQAIALRGALPAVGPWFGGVAFDLQKRSTGAWSGFPTARWVLPELLLVSTPSGTALTAFAALSGEDLAATHGRLERQLHATAQRLSAPARFREGTSIRALREDRGDWNRLIETALHAIDGERLTKVVAARDIAVECASPVPIPTVLDRLRRAGPNCTTFLVRGEDGAAFVGATPELLCAVEDRRLNTVALGGSRMGDDPTWPTEKELREHGAIVDFIAQGLRPICTELVVADGPHELRLSRLSHLQTPIHGSLRDGAGIADVVQALHPTPAVGGAPRIRALEFLREHEGLERGWYAGAVGWIGPGRAELRVALRCALIRHDQAQVFVGAGIVAGSTAEAEWSETSAKARTALAALGASDAA